MGQTISGWLELRQRMVVEFENVLKIRDKIETRVHPLNNELCQQVKNSASHAEASRIIFTDKERPNRQIRFLNLNTIMLPKLPKNPNYQTGYQYERLSDMFLDVFYNYDIICLQEVFGLGTGELKEVAISYAQKAGFLYYAAQSEHCPLPGSAYFTDSGLLILSRFPVVEQDFQVFSVGLFSDSEVKRGSLYAKVEVAPGKTI